MSREYIVPIFIPHAGCNKRCVFCNEFSTTGVVEKPDINFMEKEFSRYKQYFPKEKNIHIAFYGSTFTGLEINDMRYYLDWGKNKIDNNEAVSIRFSTSPEEVTEEKIEILKNYPVSLIELGVQSFDDEVLKHTNRPHDSKDIYKALNLLDKYEFNYGIHLMTGLPKSNYEKDIESAKIASESNASFFRIHSSIIMKDTILEKWYEKGLYKPETLDEAISKIAEMTIILESSGKKVIRLGLCLYGKEKENIVAGPYHEAFGNLVRTKIAEMILTKIDFRTLVIPQNLKSDFIGYKAVNKKYIDSKISFDNTDYFILDGEKIEYYKIINKI